MRREREGLARFECHSDALKGSGLDVTDGWGEGDICSSGPLEADDTVLGMVGEREGDLATRAHWDATKVQLIVLSSCKYNYERKSILHTCTYI